MTHTTTPTAKLRVTQLLPASLDPVCFRLHGRAPSPIGEVFRLTRPPPPSQREALRALGWIRVDLRLTNGERLKGWRPRTEDGLLLYPPSPCFCGADLHWDAVTTLIADPALTYTHMCACGRHYAGELCKSAEGVAEVRLRRAGQVAPYNPAMYSRHVSYYFTPRPGGDSYILTPGGDGASCEIEEARKNGQEDTHFSGEFWRDGDGAWTCEEYTRKHGEDYDHDVAGILSFLDANGIPPAEG